MELKKVADAACSACEAFIADKKNLSDMRPSFWAMTRLLLDIAIAGSDEELIDAIPQAIKVFGSPGDFGYGHPTGDNLAALYKAWNEYLAITRQSSRTTAEHGRLR